MLYEVKKLRPAYLILWKTDRLSRDAYDAPIAKKWLRDRGVKIVYVAETVPEDDEGTQIMVERINEAMAAMFIVLHRKNVMRGLTFNAENALYNGIKILGTKASRTTNTRLTAIRPPSCAASSKNTPRVSQCRRFAMA